jgi:hypothetical protein
MGVIRFSGYVCASSSWMLGVDILSITTFSEPDQSRKKTRWNFNVDKWRGGYKEHLHGAEGVRLLLRLMG